MKLSQRLARVSKSSSSSSTPSSSSSSPANEHDSATKSLLTGSRSTKTSRIYLGAKRMFSITSRYTCLILLLECVALLSNAPGLHCWNPYEALEYRTFNDPPMDPSLALAMSQALNGAPVVSQMTAGYLSDQPTSQQVFAPVTLTPDHQSSSADNRLAGGSGELNLGARQSPAPEVKSVLSQLASTALEVAQDVAANVVQNVVQSTTAPVAPESPLSTKPSAQLPAVEPNNESSDKTTSATVAPLNNSEQLSAATKPLSPAGKILGELVHSKNTSERLANVAFQLLRPRKQQDSSKSHAFAQQQIISQHADMFQRQLLQPVKHRDTSGLLKGAQTEAGDGGRNSPLGSVLANFKASKGISSRSSIVRAMSDNKLARALSTLGKSISANKYIAAASVLAALGLTASKFLSPYLMAGGYSKLGEPMLGSGSFMSPIFASPARQTAATLDSMMMSGSSPSNQFLSASYPSSSSEYSLQPPSDTGSPMASGFSQAGPLFQRFSMSRPSNSLANNNKPSPGESVAGYYSDFYNQNYPQAVPYSLDSTASLNPSSEQPLQSQATSFSIVTAEPSTAESDQLSYQLDSTGALTPFTNPPPPRRQTSIGSTPRRSGTVTLKLDKATRERLMRLKREQELLNQLDRYQQPQLIAFSPVSEPSASTSNSGYSFDSPATFVSFSPVGRQQIQKAEQPVTLMMSPQSTNTADHGSDNDLPPMHKSVRLTSHAQQDSVSKFHSKMAQQDGQLYEFVRTPKKESHDLHVKSQSPIGESRPRPLVVAPTFNESTSSGSGGAWRLMVQDSIATQPPATPSSTPAPQKLIQPPHQSDQVSSNDVSKPSACNPNHQNQHLKSSSQRAHISYTEC